MEYVQSLVRLHEKLAMNNLIFASKHRVNEICSNYSGVEMYKELHKYSYTNCASTAISFQLLVSKSLLLAEDRGHRSCSIEMLKNLCSDAENNKILIISYTHRTDSHAFCLFSVEEKLFTFETNYRKYGYKITEFTDKTAALRSLYKRLHYTTNICLKIKTMASWDEIKENMVFIESYSKIRPSKVLKVCKHFNKFHRLCQNKEFHITMRGEEIPIYAITL